MQYASDPKLHMLAGATPVLDFALVICKNAEVAQGISKSRARYNKVTLRAFIPLSTVYLTKIRILSYGNTHDFAI